MCLWGRKSPISTQSYKRYDFFTPSLNHCFVTITLFILAIPPLFVIWDSGAYIVYRCSDLCSGGRLTNAKSTSPMLGLVYILGASYQYTICKGIEYNCNYSQKYDENIKKHISIQCTNTENSTKLILNIHLHAWIYALCQLLVHYKENTTTNTISMLKRDRKTPRSIQIRLKVQCNCCKLTSPILRVAGSMPAAGSNHIWPVNLSEHSYSSI